MSSYPFLSWVRKDPVLWKERGWTLTPNGRAVIKCSPRKRLMVMPSNNSSALVHYLAGKYPGRMGWLVGPKAMSKTKFRNWMPFALDNDAFSAWTTQTDWDESRWFNMLEQIKLMRLPPLWAVVPDVVGDCEKTLERWHTYAPILDKYGFKKAFAVQDGMTPGRIPTGVDVIFVGGTTQWKWQTAKRWADTQYPVHIGRVNSVEKLTYCEEIGVQSVDGTGWLKDTETGRKAKLLNRWLGGETFKQPELNLMESK